MKRHRPITHAVVRRLALAFPEAYESSHFDRPDLRVRNRIFATLPSDSRLVVLKATPTNLYALVSGDGATFWNEWRGRWIGIRLDRIPLALFRKLLADAWHIVAPKKLVSATMRSRTRSRLLTTISSGPLGGAYQYTIKEVPMPVKKPVKSARRVIVENVNVPGYTVKVDEARYLAMRKALLKVSPTRSPGLSQSEIRKAVLAHLPQDLFPGGGKAPWWSKVVQLDLEAKGILIREGTKPLRWYRKAVK